MCAFGRLLSRLGKKTIQGRRDKSVVAERSKNLAIILVYV